MHSSVIPTSDRVHTHTIRICLYIYWNSRLWYSLLMLHSLIFYRFTMLFPKFSFFFCRKKNLLHFYFPPRFPFLYFLPLFPSFICSIFFFFFVHLIYSKRNCNEKEKTKTKTKMNSAKNHNQNNKKKKNRDLLGESRKIKQK